MWKITLLSDQAGLAANFEFHFFLLDFGPGQLTRHYLIPSYEVGFYEPTVFKLHPPLCGITEHGIMPVRLELSFCFILLIHEKWFPLGH